MKTAKPHISRISIGRVYNLGNYEHVRYELTVEVPAGSSASKAIVGVEKLIAGLRPIKGVKSPGELTYDAGEISRMKEMSEDAWQRQYGHCKGTRAEVTKRYEKAHAENVTKRTRALKRAAKARALFDSLNGSAAWKDAKLDWQDDYDE